LNASIVFLGGKRPEAATGGIVSVVTAVQASKPEVVMNAVSDSSKSVFMTDYLELSKLTN
jgi:hypothetical protein